MIKVQILVSDGAKPGEDSYRMTELILIFIEKVSHITLSNISFISKDIWETVVEIQWVFSYNQTS